MKKKNKIDDRRVMSCRLEKSQQEFILSFDKLAKSVGRKPSLVRALEQIMVELGFKATGCDATNEDSATRKLKGRKQINAIEPRGTAQ